MKSLIKKIAPKQVIKFLRKTIRRYNLFRFTYYDYKKVIRHSAALKGDHINRDTFRAALLMDSHRVEKGLSLPDIKKKFGLYFIPSLIDNALLYKEKYGNDIVVKTVYNAIKEYLEFHEQKGIYIDEIKEDWKKLNIDAIQSEESNLATINIDREYIQEGIKEIDFQKFVNSRHSIRNFSDKMVDANTIEKAVEYAIKTPSVCNRQPWKTYLIQGEKVKDVLELQNGNIGFRSSVSSVLIVTASLSFMRQETERHQIFIDGGMFSMSLLYALHSFGLGTCALNWCALPDNDKKLHSKTGISFNEEVIMLIAVGHYKESIKVASSPRKSVEETIVIL